uniref:Uncharacterized protein n=1 Tax=Araneus ventricosus TaxID=182803 RepID=A0A4Y1ZUM0_ARAVE|nr:hypothetical protein AVEN_3050-1 [Araneus ventricosus]GBL69094.1 hypothetical protein AVEN_64727-1 [Araneus ventricosus]
MLDSLVRVSRRVGWVTDLLPANRRPPTGPQQPTRKLSSDGPRSQSVRPQKCSPLPLRPGIRERRRRRSLSRPRDTTVTLRAVRRAG